MSRFSAPVFLAQLFAAPLLCLLFGDLAVELVDGLLGTRGNQFVAWSCYALVGFIEGYLTRIAFPDVDHSWARFVWVVPVALCVIFFVTDYRRFPDSAVREFLIIDPYSASRGLVSGFVAAPTFATCFYSFGVWAARKRSGSLA